MLNLQPDNPFKKLKARSLFLWMFVILIPVYCAAELFFLFAVPLIFGFIDLKNSKDQIVSVISSYLIDGLLCLWVLQRYRQVQINPKDVMGKLPSRDQWISIAGIIVPLLLFVIGADLLSSYFLSLLSPELFKSFLNNFLNYSLNVPNSDFQIYYYLLYSFLVFVLDPIAYEFICQGFLLHRWGTKWGIKPAILVTSVVGGLFYESAPLIEFIGSSVFSIVMSLLYLQYNTLMVPIVAHALSNAVWFGLLLRFSPKSELAATTFFSNWMLGLLCIALSAPFIIRFIYKKWSDQSVSLPFWFNRNSKNLG